MNKRTMNLFFAALLAVSVPATVMAHEEEKTNPKKDGMMSGMHEMMSECREHCEKAAASMGEVRESLSEARESNDPAQMREAIEEADAPLGMMQERMSMCMKMMDMMHGKGMSGMHGDGMSGMSGGEGMMGHGMMHSGGDAAKMAVDPVCGMKVDPETAPSATYEGKTYYFCSAEEKAEFEADPESFLRNRGE